MRVRTFPIQTDLRSPRPRSALCDIGEDFANVDRVLGQDAFETDDAVVRNPHHAPVNTHAKKLGTGQPTETLAATAQVRHDKEPRFFFRKGYVASVHQRYRVLTPE